MDLNNKQVKKLKSLAHSLKPVVMVGQHGLSDNIYSEIDIALDHHELIKVRISADKDDRKILLAEIIKKSNASLIQMIGHIAILYRINTKNPTLSQTIK